MHNITFRGDDKISSRKHVISCRVDDNKFNEIVKVANQLDVKKSDVLKLSLDDSLNKYRPINLTDKEKRSLLKNRSLALKELGVLSSIASKLSRRWLLAGNNINQIAKRVNLNDGTIDFALRNDIGKLNNRLEKGTLTKQNNALIRRLTQLWQLLE